MSVLRSGAAAEGRECLWARRIFGRRAFRKVHRVGHATDCCGAWGTEGPQSTAATEGRGCLWARWNVARHAFRTAQRSETRSTEVARGGRRSRCRRTRRCRARASGYGGSSRAMHSAQSPASETPYIRSRRWDSLPLTPQWMHGSGHVPFGAAGLFARCGDAVEAWHLAQDWRRPRVKRPDHGCDAATPATGGDRRRPAATGGDRQVEAQAAHLQTGGSLIAASILASPETVPTDDGFAGTTLAGSHGPEALRLGDRSPRRCMRPGRGHSPLRSHAENSSRGAHDQRKSRLVRSRTVQQPASRRIETGGAHGPAAACMRAAFASARRARSGGAGSPAASPPLADAPR